MLEAPYDDTGMEADAERIFSDCSLAFEERKVSGPFSGNKEICGPGIGFTLFLGLNEVVVIVVEEDVFFSMQQHMSRLMEKGVPEPVVALSVKRKLDEGSVCA